MNKNLLFSLMICATLTACGGGGSSSSSDNNGNKDDVVETPDTTTPDTTPDAFSFTDVLDLELSTEVTSNEITLTGMDDEASINIEGGEYSLNGSDFTDESGKTNAGDTLAIRLTTSNEYQTATSATLTVGDVTSTFSATTRERDITPDSVVFNAITNADLNSEVSSNTVTISGIDDNTPFSFLGSKYVLNGIEVIAEGNESIGVLNNGDELTLNLNTGNQYSTLYTGGIAIGSDNNRFLFEVTTKEDTAPSVTFSKELADDGSTTLTGQEELVLSFSETMQIDTLKLNGDMVPNCNDPADETSCLNLVWSEDNTVLNLSPKQEFYWYSNTRSLQIAITGDGILGLDETISATVLPVFETYQGADVVIGQDDFESNDAEVGTNKLDSPRGVSTYLNNGQLELLIADTENNRIVKYTSIPTINGADHNARFGQKSDSTTDGGSSNRKLNDPTMAVALNDRIYINDRFNDRAIWVASEEFDANGGLFFSGQATSLVGQDDFDTVIANQCTPSSLDTPRSMDVVAVGDDIHWLVTDYYNHRVMVWSNPNGANGSDASLVLGQTDLDTCSSNSADVTGLQSLRFPEAVWSNGENLVVSSGANNRLLVWNTFPTENDQQADFQLGQLSDTASDDNAGKINVNQRGLSHPGGIGGNKHQMCVADSNNSRVLIWNTIPESTDDLADIVIGQSDFTKRKPNDVDQDGVQDDNPDNKVLRFPYSCDMSMDQLFVADTFNHRVLIYNALNKHPGLN